jgi:hypothetical protein
MEVMLSQDSGFPRYPFHKVALVGDRAEVAELPSDSPGTENFVGHRDLEARLWEKYPELSENAEFIAGWLTQRGEEATLRLQVLARRLTADDCDRIGRALGDWCNAAGVRKLMIADASQRSGRRGGQTATWDLPDPDDSDLW